MHTPRAVLALLLLMLASCATSPAASRANRISRQPIDLLITGGRLLTMAGPEIEDGAVAIDHGIIVDIGPSAGLQPRYAAAEVIDARGKAVMPGLVNGHTHAPMTLFRGIADDRSLMDWLQNYIFPAEKENVDAEFVRWGTRLAAAEMIASGTTTFADMYYFEADIAREVRKAGLRAVLGETLIDFPAPDNKSWDEAIAYSRKFVQEFRNDSLITPALAPHAPYTVSAEHLRSVRALATELDVPILIHLSETRDELDQIAAKSGGKTPPEYLESLGFLGDDVVAAHGVWLTPDDIKLLSRRRTAVIHNPESNMMLASGVAPVAAEIEGGVEVGLGTDGPAGSNDNLDMIEEMATAARLQKLTRRDPQVLGARQVLRMATIEGARALGLDDRIGSLEKGKRADVIIIDLQSPHMQPIYSLESAIVYAGSGSDVTDTIVDGKILMRNRRLLTIDVPAVLSRARQYGETIRARLAKGHRGEGSAQ